MKHHGTMFPDTIFALSSGRLPAGVAVIRLSGQHVRSVLETMAGGTPRPRTAAYRTIHATDGGQIDRGIVLFFPGPSSFTGEDVAELHLHGGKAVVSAALSAMATVPGLRHAEAGEFTRRAFLNGKLDLLEAEALGDLISADTEAQRRFSLNNTSGSHAATYAAWRSRIIAARAYVEAELDFADEGDVPGSVAGRAWPDVSALASEVESHVESWKRAEIIRDGFDVVILGAPNAGKSSLLNALARRDVAIVTNEPGTTRDLIEVQLDLDGLKVRLTDTAGLRDQAGAVESMGIERAKARAASADLVLYMEDVSNPICPDVSPPNTMRIGSKADLGAPADNDYDFLVSVVDGSGLAELLQEIGRRAAAAAGDIGEVLPFRLRQVELLRDVASCLRQALEPKAIELRAEDLRAASHGLERIAGRIDVEDVLDGVFSKFCIGK